MDDITTPKPDEMAAATPPPAAEPVAAPTPAPDTQSAEQQAEALLQTTAPKKPKTPVGLIVFAIVVCIGLGALTIYTFVQTKKKPETQQTTTQTTTPAVTAEDVENTSKELDETVDGVDNTDVNDNDLSDSSLGL
jgi:uncharacterized protein HemX